MPNTPTMNPNIGTMNKMPTGEVLDGQIVQNQSQEGALKELEDANTANWKKLLGVDREPQITYLETPTQPEPVHQQEFFAEVEPQTETIASIEAFLDGSIEQKTEGFPDTGSIIFNEVEVVETVQMESAQPGAGSPLEEEEQAIEPEQSEKLVDFGLFFSKAGEEFYPKIEKAAKGLFSLLGGLIAEASKIFPKEIFFKYKTKEQQKRDDEKKKQELEKGALKKEYFNNFKRGAMSAEQQKAQLDRLNQANQKLGINASFEGSWVNGQLRADLESALQKAEAKETEEQKQAAQRRKVQAAMASSKKGGKPGQKIDDMNLATEKQSHWSKAIG